MAFICKKCHDKEEQARKKAKKTHHPFTNHFALSYGLCETCHKTHECADCHGS